MRAHGLRFAAVVTLVTLTSGTLAMGQAPARVIAPAIFRDGPMPQLPAMALGGGEVIVELTVSVSGTVTAVRPLRVTVPYTDLVVQAVSNWRFTPAEEMLDPAKRGPGEPATRAVESKVTVAALYRPPALYLGNSFGQASRDVDRPSDEAPFPVSMTVPAYTPSALQPGVVLTEARLDGAGAITQVSVKRSWQPFDEAAVAASREWRFRPARGGGVTTSPRVYLLFGFRLPDASVPSQPCGSTPDPRATRAGSADLLRCGR